MAVAVYSLNPHTSWSWLCVASWPTWVDVTEHTFMIVTRISSFRLPTSHDHGPVKFRVSPGLKQASEHTSLSKTVQKQASAEHKTKSKTVQKNMTVYDQ